MTGIDLSAEMLDIARNSAYDNGFGGDILWLLQDMREFELYGTVDAAVSCLDCLNHLTDPKDLKKCLSLMHNYLIPGGIFIFDVNGRGRFESDYADKSYVMEGEDSFCVWQNDYNPASKICDFYITLFKEREDGRYDRYDELQSERMYTIRSLKTALKKSGFEFIGAYSDYSMRPATDDDKRIYIVTKCIKEV